MSISTEEQKNRVAKIINTKRKEYYGYTGGNRDLAELIGVSPQLLSMWARNKRSPGQQDLLKLSEVFDIPFDDLYRLNKHNKKTTHNVGKKAPIAVNSEEWRSSMLKICDIATDLVNRQKQMLHGELDANAHEKVLSRIKKYVDIVS